MPILQTNEVIFDYWQISMIVLIGTTLYSVGTMLFPGIIPWYLDRFIKFIGYISAVLVMVYVPGLLVWLQGGGVAPEELRSFQVQLALSFIGATVYITCVMVWFCGELARHFSRFLESLRTRI